MSFQLLGIIPVTRKAPHAATLSIFLRSRDAVVWNLRLTDVKDKRKKDINKKNGSHDRELQEETDGQEAQIADKNVLRNGEV